MYQLKKKYFVIVVFCFFATTPKLYSQQNTGGETNLSQGKSYRQDSIKVRALLSAAGNCIKSGSSNCIRSINSALKISTAYKSAFLTALCYSAFANAERRGRAPVLFTYDSLSIEYARLSKNDSLLIVNLLNTSHDFCIINRSEKARKLIDESFELLKNNDYGRLIILANYEEGFYLVKSYRFNDAGNQYKKALKYAELYKDEFWKAMLYKSIFWVQSFGYKQMDKEIPIFEVLDYFRKTDAYETANCLYILGYTNKMKGNTNKAADYFTEAASLYKAEKYYLLEAEMYLMMADIYMVKKEYSKALFFAGKSDKIYNSLQYNFGITNTYLNYGKIYGAAGNITQSDFYFNKADSFLIKDPNKMLSTIALSYKALREVNRGNIKSVSSLIDSAAKDITDQLPREVTDSIISRAETTDLLSKAEAGDLKKYVRTGKLDSILWNKKQDLEGINPYTADLPRFNSRYNELFNRQITEMETRYRTKIKDDSLKNVINENKISQLKIGRQNWLIFLVSVIALAVVIILYQINGQRKRVVAEKKTVEVLKAEADHRVQNTLNTINSIIRIVKSQSGDKQHFNLLEERIDPLMILYQMLSSKKDENVELQDYFLEICNRLQKAYGNTHVEVNVFAPVIMEGKRAGITGLIVNELVTNSFKYAFKEKQGGMINVVCEKDAKGGYKLQVSDSGTGFTRPLGNTSSRGLLLVKALAEQLRARMTERSEAGVSFEFYFT